MIVSSLLARVLVTGFAIAGLCRATQSQALHVDTRFGFQFKPPKDFNAVAVDPLERTVLAKYQARNADASGDAGGASFSRIFELEFYPRGAPLDEEVAGASSEDAPKTMAEQVQRYLDERYTNYSLTDQHESSIAGAKALELKYTADDQPLSRYCAILEQEDGVFVFQGSALSQRFKDAAAEFAKSARTFKRVEKADRTKRDAELAQMSEEDRFLQEQIEKLPPGWSSLRTKRYLFLFDAEKDFVKVLADRIEGMRDEYEKRYPPTTPITAVSIVRVTADRDEYLAYGGSQNSGGYWNWVAHELVCFDFRPRELTMAVINHEAFHQYIYYFYGQLSPHSWYNEGHGDYFAGAKMTKTNHISGFGDAPGGIGRQQDIKEGARLLAGGKKGKDGAAAPLKELMAFHQADYYGGKGYDAGVCYAEGWALVLMLREGKGLDEKWKKILPAYLDNLLAARHEVAVQLMNKAVKNWEQAKADIDAGSDNAPTELPKEPSRDPKDYYFQASTAKEDDVQDLAFKKTFTDWTDGDWESFQDFYLNYVEKL